MACLFMAAKAGVIKVVVEHDEDVEIVLSAVQIYVQVKTRSAPLIYSDIDGAMPDNRNVAETTAYFHQEVKLMGDAVKAAGIEPN